jgi:hypothetical protein
MTAVARRVSDRYLLALIKAWLEMPVEECDERGRQQRTTRHRDEGQGTPQGAPLSPLLSNLYMRRFILGWKVLGHERRLDAHIVNDADDFVICCRGSAEEALTAMRDMMAKLKLTITAAKTRLGRGPDEPFDFLSYPIGRCYAPQTGGAYIGVRPSDRSLQRLKLKLCAPTDRRWEWRDVDETVARLNRLLGGWANSFCLGTVTKAYREVTAHAGDRLRRWRKQQFDLRGPPQARFSDRYLHETLGLLRLQRPSARLV